MKDILAFEADRRAFIITINSFDTDLSKDDRAKLFPKIGKYVPKALRRGREIRTGTSLKRGGTLPVVSFASPFLKVEVGRVWRRTVLCAVSESQESPFRTKLGNCLSGIT
jgi:hypothetical protein